MTQRKRPQELLSAPDSERSTRRWSRWVTVLAACMALVIGISTALALALVRRELGAAPIQSEGEPAAQSVISDVAPSLPTLLKSVPIYYVGRTDGLLYREFHDLASQGGIESTAVAALFNVAPFDPDYESYWSQGAVRSLEHVGNRIVINLSKESFNSFTSLDRARRAITQLVYTVTAASGDPAGVKTVQVLADGSAALPVIGVPSDDFARTGMDPLGRLWITAPENQAAVPKGKVTIALQTQSDDDVPTVTVAETASGEPCPPSGLSVVVRPWGGRCGACRCLWSRVRTKSRPGRNSRALSR